MTTLISEATSRRAKRQTPALERRDDIQGLRTVAALLVAIYHIWTHRISGAVDVFFVVSAFVMTQSLLREIQRSGRVSLPRFYRNLLFRMAPLAWMVVGGSMLAALVLLPITEWSTIGEQATAAALFHINYYLGLESMAYLGEAANSSLFQHFWAMAVQVQFYLLFPLLGAAAVLAARGSKRIAVAVLAGLLAVVFAASFVYATVSVVDDQAFAYFDTGARAWEFAAGALAAIVVPNVPRLRLIGGIVAALGLGTLVSFGAFIDVTTLFPGPAALIPVSAALAILLGGSASSGIGAARLLAWRPLVVAAEFSFGFYLWHWPVLALHRQLTEQQQLGPVEGIGVIAISALLAFATQRYIEKPVRIAARAASSPRAWRTALIGLAAIAIVPVLAVGGTRGYVDWVLAATPVDNPGAAVVAEEAVELSPFAEVQPPLATLENGQWEEWGETCEARFTDTGAEFRACTAGDADSPLQVVALGDSHTENWLTAFAPSIESGAIRLTSYFRGACPLSTEGGDKLGIDHEDVADCASVNAERIALTIQDAPDFVFTTGNIATAGSPSLDFTSGFVDAVEQLALGNVSVVTIRDIPRHVDRFSACLEETGMDQSECSVSADSVLSPMNYIDSLPGPLWENPIVTGMDLTWLVCFDNICPPVVGGIIPYVDDNHLTRAFVATMEPYFIDELKTALHAIGTPIPSTL